MPAEALRAFIYCMVGAWEWDSCVLLINKRRFWASVRKRDDPLRGETERVCTSAVKWATLADQQHLHARAVNICVCPSLSVHPALQLGPPVFPTRCAHVCASVGERQTRLSHALLAVTEESRLWGHARVSGTPPTIIIQTGSFPLGYANIFIFWTFFFIFQPDLQCFLHSSEIWLIDLKLQSVLIEKPTSYFITAAGLRQRG